MTTLSDVDWQKVTNKLNVYYGLNLSVKTVKRMCQVDLEGIVRKNYEDRGLDTEQVTKATRDTMALAPKASEKVTAQVVEGLLEEGRKQYAVKNSPPTGDSALRGVRKGQLPELKRDKFGRRIY